MQAIEPFRALRYDDERVELSRVVTRPGVKPEQDQDSRSAREIVEPVVEGEDPDFQRRAARQRLFLAAWQRARVVERDEEDAIYYLRGELDGEPVVSGFFALARPDAGTPFVLHTPEPGRVEWERARRDASPAEAELVVLAHEDDARDVAKLFRAELDREGDVRFETEDGVEWELWVVDDETTIARVQSRLKERRLVVLTGTERWSSALGRGEDPRVLTFIGSYRELESVVAPVHLMGQDLPEGAGDDLLNELRRRFRVRDLEGEIPDGAAVLYARGTSPKVIEPGDADGPFALLLAEAALEVLPGLERAPQPPASASTSLWMRFPAPDLASLVAYRETGRALPRGLFRLDPDIPRGLVIATRTDLDPRGAE
jgi:hypothetical protein